MNKFFYVVVAVLLMSCSADDASTTSETVELLVEHYQTTNVLSGLSYVVQEGEAIGSEQFSTLDHIEGFEFEAGFTYNLNVEKTRIKNAGTNATTVQYSLLEVLNKLGVQPGRQFSVPLSTSVAGLGHVSFLSRTLDSTYVLGGRIPIDCRSYCGNLDAIIDQELLAEGIFSHGPDDSYILEELLD